MNWNIDIRRSYLCSDLLYLYEALKFTGGPSTPGETGFTQTVTKLIVHETCVAHSSCVSFSARPQGGSRGNQARYSDGVIFTRDPVNQPRAIPRVNTTEEIAASETSNTNCHFQSIAAQTIDTYNER